MLKALGLDWRISLAQEGWFYFRTCKNWRQVFRSRLRGGNLDKLECRAGQVITLADFSSLQIFQEIWRRQIYTGRYPKRWEEPRVIVDIGANIGIFALFATKKWPLARVLAYEPAPENVVRFERNIRLSHASQICFHPFAVAGTKGRTTLFLKGEPGWHSFWNEGARSAVCVEATTLEAILAEVGSPTIDLLKIDCEGAEYDVLRGRGQLLVENVRFIAMEYHEREDHRVRELTDLFESSGFSCVFHPEPCWGTGMLYATNGVRTF